VRCDKTGAKSTGRKGDNRSVMPLDGVGSRRNTIGNRKKKRNLTRGIEKK
jgi:hypothetical protein